MDVLSEVQLKAINIKDGKVIYSYNIKNKINNFSKKKFKENINSMILANNDLYIFTDKSKVLRFSINGEIENGDYIESSVIKGYGRKQDDDILRSKTVAKCTETIDWTQVTSSIQYSGSNYKKYLCAATFHCG